MSIKYEKLQKTRDDSTSSANLLSPADTDRSSISSSVWLPLDSVTSDGAKLIPQQNASSSGTTPCISVQNPTLKKKQGHYSVPKCCYLFVPDDSTYSRSNHCETSIPVHYDESCNSMNTEVDGAPTKKHKHFYANASDFLTVVQKPRAKSFTRIDAERAPPFPPKNVRRTLSRIQPELDPHKTPQDTWCKAANRVGRLNTRLLEAIEYHNNVEVESMLMSGANPNATCRAGHISACHAAAFTNSDALHLLLKYSAESDRKDKFGRTPLHLAAWAGRNWTIAMLLDFPIDLQYKVVLRVTPEAEEEIKELRPHLKSIIDVPCELPIISVLPQNWKDSIEHKCRRYMSLLPKFFSGWTPLHIASYAAHHEATRLLLAAGANPNSKDAMGQTPLDIAGAACYLESSRVHVDEFVKTVKTLIDFGGKLNVSDTRPSDSALHTAVELCSIEAIEILLEAGAPIGHHNARGNTPLHECVEKQHHEPLQVLANYRRPNQTDQSVDVVDSSGYTVLHVAILTSWVPGVCVALDAGASVTLEAYDGKTAIHLAALQGNLDILDEVLLNAAQYENAINYDNKRTEPPIFCAIRSGNLECVQAFLDAGALLKMTYYIEPTLGDTTMEPYLLSIDRLELKIMNMILHATAEVANVEMLEMLFEHNKILEHLLSYKCAYLKNMIPVEFAAYHNKFNTYKFLLQKTIERHDKFAETYDHSRLLHIIATLNREDLFIELMRQIPDAVQTANGKGYYPLHDAARNGHRNLIAQLLHYGADLSETDEYGVSAMNLVIDNLSKPTEFLSKVLDSYINTSSTTQNTNCEITVDYRVIIPNTVMKLESKGQMRVLRALLKNKNRQNQRKLLAHPLIESFLYLKWKTLSTYFHLMVFLYSMFAISLSAYTVSVFYYKDRHNKTLIGHPDYPCVWNPEVWQYIIYVTLGIVVIQELSCTNLLPKTWIRRVVSLEFWIKFVTFCLTIATSQVISMEYVTEPGKIDWQRHLACATLVLGWLNIMMLLSKTPMSGYYMQMFWVVSSKIIKILITFLFLILIFSFCFMIQFHSQEPFEGPWAAIVKTLVMMTSEFDYSNTFTRDKAKTLTTSIQLLRFIFVVFLILASIVLMNLTIGVAVHDVQNLVEDGILKRLDKQVGFLNRLEVSRGKKSFFHFLGLYRWFNCKKVPQTVKIKPVNDGECAYSIHIKEAIMNKAQEQVNKIEREAESNKVELKLESITQAVKDIEVNVLHHIFDLKSSLQHVHNTPLIERNQKYGPTDQNVNLN